MTAMILCRPKTMTCRHHIRGTTQWTIRAALVVGLLAALPASLSAPAAASSTPSTSTPSMSVRGYPVKVYFSRHPRFDDQFGAVFAVWRMAPSLHVATFALSQLRTGPTRVEARAGYYSALAQYYPFPPHYQAPSPDASPERCGACGFTIRLNRRGASYERGTATVQFCRSFTVPGVGAAARIMAEVGATLRQFASIRRVVILNAGGGCFGDLSGLNRCLRAAV